MNVDSIISRIAKLSSDEDSPDLESQQRILDYVNLAHFEIYQRTAVLNSNRLGTTEDLTQTAGSSTISAEPFKVLSVVDLDEERLLEERHIEDIEQDYPMIDDIGSPDYFYLSGTTTLNTYPLNNADVRIRYIPMPTELALGGAESTIPYPSPYHRALIMGGLYYMYQDERDFRTVQEISVAKNDFKESINEIAQHLSQNARKPVQTKYVDF